MGIRIIFRIYIFIKYEAEEITGLQSLLKPFSTGLWACIGFWLIISSCAVIILDYFLKRSTPGSFNLINSLFTSFDALLGQSDENSGEISSRILHLSFGVKTLFLLPAYTGAVVAFLMVLNPFYPFKSFNDFVNDGTYELIAITGSHYQYYFKVYKKSENNTWVHKIIIEMILF